MAVTPGDLLGLADVLSRELTEVAWRASISRSYYAAHHAARGKLEDRYGDLGAVNAHHRVCKAYRDATRTHLQRLGEQLRRLQLMREDADYVLAGDFPTQHDAEDAHERAARLLARLEGLAATEFGYTARP